MTSLFEDRRKEIYALNVTVGTDYLGNPNFESNVNVDPSTITARLELKSTAGVSLAVFATAEDSSADGTITISMIGTDGDKFVYQAELFMDDADTTAKFAGLIADSENRGYAGAGTLAVSSPTTGGPWDCGLFQLRLEQA